MCVHGIQANLKVIVKVHREHDICETYIVDTDAYDVQWNHHRRRTRDFFVHPVSSTFGHITCVKFAFVVHLGRTVHSFPVGLHFHGRVPR